jgi:hypothetical protein
MNLVSERALIGDYMETAVSMNLVSERALIGDYLYIYMETAVSTIRLHCNFQTKGGIGQRVRIHTNSQLNCSGEYGSYSLHRYEQTPYPLQSHMHTSAQYLAGW